MAGKVITAEVKGLRELDYALSMMLPTMERERVILRALHDGARPITAEAKRQAPVLKDEGQRVVRQVAKRGRTKAYFGTRYRIRGALREGITQHTDRHHYSTVIVRVRNRGYIFGPGARNADQSKAGNPNYWWLVHFGTSKMKGIRFLYNAFDANKDLALNAIRVSLFRGMLVVGQRLGFDVRGWVEAA